MIADIQKDSDTLSQSDPELAGQINESLARLTDLQNQALEGQNEKLRKALDYLE
jgi:hypothetical protein